MVSASTEAPRVGLTRPSQKAGVLRLGVVPYLNVAPIIHGLMDDPAFELVAEVPSAVSDALHSGAVDLGMIPSIEYADHGYSIVPGIAIASRGAVRSVRLFHRRPIRDVRRVALDTSSRTSVALVKILLEELLPREPEYIPLAPAVDAMLERADAALVIGDPALDYSGDLRSLDLGEEWTSRTGLPFVFAFWAGRPGAVGPEQLRALGASLGRGLASLSEIARSYPRRAPGKEKENEDYLRRNIVFDLGEAEQRGLQEFYRRAHTLGLIRAVPEIKFYGHS